jgi:hypothetical protein
MGDNEIKRFRGDTKSIGVTITKDKLPYPITDCTFKLTVHTIKDPVDEAPKFTSDGVIVNPLLGTVVFPVTLLAADLAPATYHYDVQMTDSAGKIHTLTKDNYKITQDITK